MNSFSTQLSRRTLLRLGLSIPPTLLAACATPLIIEPTPAPAQPVALPTVTPTPAAAVAPTATVAEPAPTAVALLPPTPACGDDDDDPTPSQTEGPYYTPNTPERNSFLEPGLVGTPMIVTGYVLSTDCQPIAGALLDFWHCDDAGQYDNVGYKLRGHCFTDEQGRYTLETIRPGLYPGRTRHFHVKVQAPNQPILTTQLYFPDEPDNARDGIFRPECLMAVEERADGLLGTFNFVLQLA